MTGLDKITSKILADAQDDARRTLETAEAQCARLREELDARREASCAALNSEAEREAQSIISRAKSAAALEKRAITTAARSRLVDAAYARARERLLGQSRGDYTAFLVQLTCYAFCEQLETERVNRELYGEAETEADCYELRLCAEDRAKLGRNVINDVRNRLAGRVDRETVERLHLSEDDAPIDGGIILRYGDVELNCSIDMLLGSLRDETEAAVCAALFD